ncbi:MAG: hypothetical protein ACOYD9_01270 [Pyramidobacter sp.]|jgi:hypothetical protein
MSVYDGKNAAKGEPPLQWYVGVPIGSNPLILVDFATALVVTFLLCFLVILAAQFYFDGYVGGAHLRGAAIISADLCLLLCVFYAVVCFIALRNRYAAQYRFDVNGARCNNLKAYPKPKVKKALHFRCYPIEDQREFSKNVERHVHWEDVTRVAELPELGVLTLKGRRGMLLRVYCPDEKTYRSAREYLKSKTGV